MDYLTKLIEWCRPIESGHPFFRPLVSKCRWEEIDTFLVGLNPATPIFYKDCNLDEYAGTLVGNYELFEEIYWNVRGKPEGRTRQGINALQEWISSRSGCGVAETNVNPYPTADSNQLYLSDLKEAREQGRKIFLDLLKSICPSLLIAAAGVFTCPAERYVLRGTGRPMPPQG